MMRCSSPPLTIVARSPNQVSSLLREVVNPGFQADTCENLANNSLSCASGFARKQIFPQAAVE